MTTSRCAACKHLCGHSSTIISCWLPHSVEAMARTKTPPPPPAHQMRQTTLFDALPRARPQQPQARRAPEPDALDQNSILALSAVFGHQGFRPGQRATCRAAAQGRDCVVILPYRWRQEFVLSAAGRHHQRCYYSSITITLIDRGPGLHAHIIRTVRRRACGSFNLFYQRDHLPSHPARITCCRGR